ncbi:MAG TPA: hypothetical protein VI138_02345 [Candidatus Dormibacteraeota bacterium]
MARRTRRRPTSTARKRPGSARAPRPGTNEAPASIPPGEVAETEPVEAAAAQAPLPGPAPTSLLPRRRRDQAPPEPASPPPAVETVAPPAPPSASFLPTRTGLPTKAGRIAGRAERQRQQQANLEPLDDSPAIPVDRTPYLWLDLRRVIFVSACMVVLVIVGAVVLH